MFAILLPKNMQAYKHDTISPKTLEKICFGFITTKYVWERHFKSVVGKTSC